jgi:pimeloyl-ACP methyl ester carboxylesterase
MKTVVLFFLYLSAMLSPVALHAQGLKSVQYPYPVKHFFLRAENKSMSMAYMDVQQPNTPGETILLLHGKNFNGFYWKQVMDTLIAKGYRVIVPDQVGWGKSSHPDIHYSFHLLASFTKRLLDTLGVKKVIVVGHSMGGMLATRFALMYPAFVQQLILENPIGLEDYRTFVPYKTVDDQYKKEQGATYESYKKYQQTYYPVWKPEYEALVKVQAAALKEPDFKAIALANAITTQMIYEQPVCYEFNRLTMPVLFIIGAGDRTIVGKDLLTEEVKAQHGQVLQLAQQIVQTIPGSKLVSLQGVGHIPHVQTFDKFLQAVESFIPKTM